LTLYSDIVNHPSTSDELRRDTEAKILRYKHNFRCALAQTGEDVKLKINLGDEIRDIIDGVVLLGIPDELAWNMHLESQDHASLGKLYHVCCDRDII
jgi:superkiller protein 3